MNGSSSPSRGQPGSSPPPRVSPGPATVRSPGGPSPFALRPPTVEEFQFQDWKISTTKHRIMNSEENEEVQTQLKLPHLPDMLFIHNHLDLVHKDGLSIRMLPLPALERVDATQDLIHVAASKEWMESRQNQASSAQHLKVVHPYDWTFSTDYSGTITHQTELRKEETSERIDYEKLKVEERILFFDEVILYEDELDDNGCTKLSTKIRVMPSGFFVLLRFYLRVDQTLIRIHDTRFYFQTGKDYILQEYSEREDSMSNLSVCRELCTDQNRIVDHLPVKKSTTSKIFLV
jgi:type 2A phosphatase activator TIP41